jgi:hypothetical protein
MCRLASFFHNPMTGDLAVYDITSHSETEKKLNLNLKIWREGHYLPNGEVECRVTDDDRITQKECDERLKQQYPTFVKFFNWCIGNGAIASEGLDLNGCDLTGITLPETIGGGLYLIGCDLTGITLPETIGGSLNLRGCDLTNITIPERFKHKVVR